MYRVCKFLLAVYLHLLFLQGQFPPQVHLQKKSIFPSGVYKEYGIKPTSLCTTNEITPAPGQDPEARIVLSYSRNTPHMVTPKKGGDFCCSQRCPNWKAMGICSHTVKSITSRSSFCHGGRGVNVTKMLTTTMPRGRGRKWGAAPRVRIAPKLIETRIEMATSSAEKPGTPPVTSNAQQYGTCQIMPLLISVWCTRQLTIMVHTPHMFSPYQQGMPHESSNMLAPKFSCVFLSLCVSFREILVCVKTQNLLSLLKTCALDMKNGGSS